MNCVATLLPWLVSSPATTKMAGEDTSHGKELRMLRRDELRSYTNKKENATQLRSL